MNGIEQYSEDIYKCSKCALCQSVCPVYKISKNESIVSRGRFVALKGVLDKDIPLTKSLASKMNTCLNCNACKNFCPSDIDAKNIFASVKNEFNRKNLMGHFLHSQKFVMFLMSLIGIASTIYRFIKMYKLIDLINPMLHKLGILGKRIILANEILKPRIVDYDKTICKHKTLTGKVVFFQGCFNRFINSSSKNATEFLLSKMGYEILKMNQTCCNVHSYYGGYFSEFNASATSILESIPEDVQYIVCDCASCESVLKSYDKLVDSKIKIADKVINIADLLIKADYQLNLTNDKTFTYHKPCHSDQAPSELFSKYFSESYIEMQNPDECCGLSGEFAIRYQKLSREISLNKANSICDTNSEYVVTSCPACVLGLYQGLIEKKCMKQVMNISEFIALNISK